MPYVLGRIQDWHVLPCNHFGAGFGRRGCIASCVCGEEGYRQSPCKVWSAARLSQLSLYIGRPC